MKHVFEQKAACTACKATGLYVGMAEHDGAAVVCHACEGTGEKTIRIEWDDFEGRQGREGVTRVFEVNPGIGIGEDAHHKLSDFGGMPYAEWCDGKPFGRGSENRNCTCPAWWYQSANYKLKPEWDECRKALGRSFAGCPSFKDKGACWARWDRENPS